MVVRIWWSDEVGLRSALRLRAKGFLPWWIVTCFWDLPLILRSGIVNRTNGKAAHHVLGLTF